jgi:uncharacterized protein YjiS (DUF1127 family)
MTATDISYGPIGSQNVGGPVAAAKAVLRNWILYRRTLAELQALDDSDLRDLGLGRSDLTAIAREAVRTNRA